MPTTIPTVPVEVEALVRALDLDRMAADLTELCDVRFAGRRVASAGHDRAQAWLKERMEQLGLTVELTGFKLEAEVLDVYDSPLFEIPDEGRRLRYRIDYAEHPRSSDLPETADTSKWTVLDAVPRGEALEELVASEKHAGAAGLLVPQFTSDGGFLSKRIVARNPIGLPMIAVSATLLPELLGKRLRIRLPLRRRPVIGAHVVGVQAGNDPRLANEPILVGAHYDALGDDTDGPRLPGAADNAAAVAVVLELARVFAIAAPLPHPIWFVAFDAEEVDALGTNYYASTLGRQGVRPLVVNLDMAAQLHAAIIVEPGGSPTRILDALDQAGEWLEQPLVVGNVSSDNRRFAEAGFEVVGIGLGGAEIHTPADTRANVDPKAPAAAARLLLATVWQLATDGSRTP